MATFQMNSLNLLCGKVCKLVFRNFSRISRCHMTALLVHAKTTSFMEIRGYHENFPRNYYALNDGTEKGERDIAQ